MAHQLIDLTNADLLPYQAFLMTGLRDHADAFRLSVSDEAGAGFPTKGTADSFTIAAVDSTTGRWQGVVSFARNGDTREKLRHKGLLFRMYVSADSAGRGIGRALIQAVIDRVRVLPNMEQINLTVIASNERAIRLYESVGFIAFSREERSIKSNGRYFDKLTMALRL
ncbi:MAG: ThiJ/PfpI protein [Spirosoma sp.]|nr:ThiJ/PfpI protein [Spirosoma sp.]